MNKKRISTIALLACFAGLWGCKAKAPEGSPNSNLPLQDGETSNVSRVVAVHVLPAAPFVRTGSSLQFSANVTGTTINSAVVWQVNGVVGGDPRFGRITQSGVFIAPAQVPHPNTVTVTAVSSADSSKSGSATATIRTPTEIVVSVSPEKVFVTLGTTRQFKAKVTNTADTALVWKVNGIVGGDATVGTISPLGLYTPPRTIPSPPTVTITAVSRADPSVFSSATASMRNVFLPHE